VFATCIYCNQPLGANEALEEFPVGRRLAFDGAKGRLWVVCRKCERWNLSPLDTRWEAVEACERAFRSTRMRVSTENMGLARLSEGLELVRVGAPLRPEFAAWRYGDQFGRRHRRALLIGAGAGLGVAGVMIAGAAVGIGFGAFGGFLGNIPNMVVDAMRSTRVKLPDGRVLKMRGNTLAATRLSTDSESGEPVIAFRHARRVELFRGDEALQLAGRLLPSINVAGGSKANVRDAVRVLDDSRGPEGFIASYLRNVKPAANPIKAKAIARVKSPMRLALEMALHEEAERRAIEGELHVLEAAWRDAEEIASISDDMLLSPDVLKRLGAMKDGVSEPAEE
jgi:hypothetical protein